MLPRKPSKWRLLELYTIGFFANSFLPGAVGGDVVRWQLGGNQLGERLKIAATIVAERATGVVALLVMCVLAVAFAVTEFRTPPVLTLIAAMSFGALAALAAFASRRIATLAMYQTRRSPIRRVIQPLYRLNRTLRCFTPAPLALALGHSVLFYLSAGLTYYLICLAFDVRIGIVEAIAAQALVALLIMVPISIGGLGLSQAADVYLLGILGIPAADALAISIMRLLFRYLYAFIGGALYVRLSARSGAGRNDRAIVAGSEADLRERSV